MTTRLATMDDLGAIKAMVATASAELEEFGTGRQDELVVHWIAYGIEHGEAVFVAEEAQMPVGFCAWVRIPGLPDGTVAGLCTWVHPGFRRRRVGRLLRRAGLSHCKQRGYKRIQGEIALTNRAGQKSARAMGFQVIGVIVAKEL